MLLLHMYSNKFFRRLGSSASVCTHTKHTTQIAAILLILAPKQFVSTLL